MLRSDLYDYSDAYTVLRGAIDLLTATAYENDKISENGAFKNNTPFRSYISTISNTLIDNAEYLDIVMLIYNIFQYNLFEYDIRKFVELFQRGN